MTALPVVGGPGAARSSIFALTIDDPTRARRPVVAGFGGGALRASAHENACLAFEHAGRRPPAVERPINAIGAGRCGDALDVT